MITVALLSPDEKWYYDFDSDFKSLPTSFRDLGTKSTLTEEKADGRDGTIFLDRTLGNREFVSEFSTFADSVQELNEIIDKIREVLLYYPQLYLYSSELGNKRALVTSDGPVLSTKIGSFGEFELKFRSSVPVVETVNKVFQTYKDPTFEFENEGNYPLNPRNQEDTQITFRGISDGLTIKNLTTGDEWSYNGTTVDGDEIVLKGVRSLKNGESIFGATNKKLITIAPGINNFEIVGASDGFELTIESRFYFL